MARDDDSSRTTFKTSHAAQQTAEYQHMPGKSRSRKTAVANPHRLHDDLQLVTMGYPPIVKERRAKSRYPLDLSVRFRLSLGSKAFSISGAGRTVNLSTGGLLVSSEELPSHDEITAGV